MENPLKVFEENRKRAKRFGYSPNCPIRGSEILFFECWPNVQKRGSPDYRFYFVVYGNNIVNLVKFNLG